ncbi:MAG: protein kinase [Verrucomicrobiota bacterium]
MANPHHNFIAGNERDILAQMIADEEMQEAGVDGFIGPYRLVECLGEGGFGFVWRAEQTEPVRREVALKVLKRGMDTAQVLARFSLEQQALASMEHPHIAALLDAGVTHDGRPFFAMELVRGSALTTYCQDKSLPWEKRVALFRDVCGGVQHAHQKGMIHRDLKPSNILVAEVDGKPAPKIIDFGIAKAMTGMPMQEAYFTRAGHVMGTPLYMSPEQLSGSKDIDIRSDVYALGVLFYEMLTGSLPYQSAVRQTTSVTEMLRILNDERPVRPSVRVTETVKMPAVREAMQQNALAHVTGIPVDLDWIILKALESERDRRYDSVASLMADVEHFLRDEPVLARPPSLSYLAGRWIKRNRLVFAAACVCLCAICGGAAVALWQAHAARLAQRVAETESARAQQAVGFLTAMLDRVATEISNGRNPEALKLALENSQQTIDGLGHDPALQIELYKRVGWLYEAMGERKLALPLIKAHMEALGKIHGPDSQIAWEAELPFLIKTIDHGARGSAPPLVEALLKRVAAKGLGRSSFAFIVKRQLVRVWTKLDQPAKAAQVAREALREMEGVDLPGTTAFNLKASCVDALRAAKDYEAAERVAVEALEFCRTVPELHGRNDWLEDKLIEVMRDRGDHQKAMDALAARVERLKAHSAEDPRPLVTALLALGVASSNAGKLDAAIRHAGEASRIASSHAPSAEALKTTGSLQTLRDAQVDALCDLVGYESRAKKHQEAIAHAREAYRIADEQGNVTRVSESLQALANAQSRAGDLDGAFETYLLSSERSGQRGANYLRWHEDLQSMCQIRLQQGRAEEALKLAVELWHKERVSKEAREDKGHMSDVAQLALRCHQALQKKQPATPVPPEVVEWESAMKRR